MRISSLNTKSSCGIDGIAVKFLKFLSPALIKPLTSIINHSLITGIFPTKLKIAKVLPLFKKKKIKLLWIIKNQRLFCHSYQRCSRNKFSISFTNIFKIISCFIPANMGFKRATQQKWQHWSWQIEFFKISIPNIFHWLYSWTQVKHSIL